MPAAVVGRITAKHKLKLTNRSNPIQRKLIDGGFVEREVVFLSLSLTVFHFHV
jgi:hypothetical protein